MCLDHVSCKMHRDTEARLSKPTPADPLLTNDKCKDGTCAREIKNTPKLRPNDYPRQKCRNKQVPVDPLLTANKCRDGANARKMMHGLWHTPLNGAHGQHVGMDADKLFQPAKDGVQQKYNSKMSG